MTLTKLLPTAMIVLSFGAAIVYAIDDIKNWNQILYWTCAGGIGISVAY